MEKTFRAFAKKVGVNVDRIDKSIKAEKLDLENVVNWGDRFDNIIGLQWQQMVEPVIKKEVFDIGGVTLATFSKDENGVYRKRYKLPHGMNSDKFGKWLETYREIVDMWIHYNLKKPVTNE